MSTPKEEGGKDDDSYSPSPPSTHVLFLVDVRGWSLHNIAAQLATRFPEWDVSIETIRDYTAWFVDGTAEPPPRVVAPWRVDTVFALWYGAAEILERAFTKRTLLITCVFDASLWTPDSLHPSKDRLRDWLTRAARVSDVVCGASPEIADLLQTHLAIMNSVPLCMDGVDIKLFDRPADKPFKLQRYTTHWPIDVHREDGSERSAEDHSRDFLRLKNIPPSRVALRSHAILKVGWVGSSTGPSGVDKGLSLVREAVSRVPSARLFVRDRADGPVAHTDMPAFYHDLDVLVCFSYKEGTPNPVLEAAACGVPFVSTAVGVVPYLWCDAMEEWLTPPGLIIPRRVDVLTMTLLTLSGMNFGRPSALLRDMGDAAYATVRQGWTWEKRAPQYLRAAQIARMRRERRFVSSKAAAVAKAAARVAEAAAKVEADDTSEWPMLTGWSSRT